MNLKIIIILFIIPLILLNLYNLEFLDNLKDKAIMYSSLYAYLITSFSIILKLATIKELTHIFYVSLMVFVPLISKSKNVLIQFTVNSIIALMTRRLFNGCLINKVYKKKIVRIKFPIDIIFGLSGLISILKLL